MLRWNGFGRSLIFAAAAAAGLPVAVVFAGPAIGAGLTVKLYMLTAAGCYASGLGDRPGPKVIPVGKPAGDADQVNVWQYGVAVPDHQRIGA